MADLDALPPPIREGARRAYTYNDGLVVYLYDESFRDALAAAGADELLRDALAGEKPNAQAKALLASKRVVAYELYQDDEVVVDVCVGAPLTTAERKARRGVTWHKPVTTVIALPTGRLRVESANSCRFNGEEPDAEGATVEVPPGEYLLTLHRVDWQESTADPPGVAGETVTLTPLADVAPPKRFSAVLAYPDRPKVNWVGKFAVDGSRFEAQANFVSPWDFVDLNLDRAAGEKLGLGTGSVIDVDADGRRVLFVMLGDAMPYSIMAQANGKALFGHDRTTAGLADAPEVVLARWVRHPDANVEILRGMRVKQAAAAAKPGKWQKATGEVRAARLPLPDLEDLGKWRRDGDAVVGRALLVCDNVVSVSLAPEALAALGALAGEVLTVAANGATRSLLLVESPSQAVEAMQAREPRGEARERYMDLRGELSDASGAAKVALQEQIRALLTPDPPLVGFMDRYWLDPARPVFCVMPLGMSKASIGVNFTVDLPCRPGDEVTLRRR